MDYDNDGNETLLEEDFLEEVKQLKEKEQKGFKEITEVGKDFQEDIF